MGILVTGIAGALAQDVARRLIAAGREVVGVDYRPVEAIAGLRTYRAHYNKTAIDDVFRRHSFEAVLHLGRVGNLAEDVGMRFDLNVIGTQRIMQSCLTHKVKALVVLSTFHIYGANPLNHVPISEEDPLRSGYEFPEIADAIQLDNMATNWVHRHPEVRVAVLRPTNVIGARLHNTMSQLLRLPRVPHLVGFNPMMQFIDEEDLGPAIVTALVKEVRGVYNVVGGDALPWRTALALAGARTFPLPSSVIKLYLKTFSSVPAYLVNFFKYHCIITDAAFRRDTGWNARVPIRDTLVRTVASGRARGRA